MTLETRKYFENDHEILWTPSCPSTGLLVTGVMVVVMAARPSSDNIPSLTSQIGLVCRDQLPSHQPVVAAHFLQIIDLCEDV